jgi:hypothetical protein
MPERQRGPRFDFGKDHDPASFGDQVDLLPTDSKVASADGPTVGDEVLRREAFGAGAQRVGRQRVAR